MKIPFLIMLITVIIFPSTLLAVEDDIHLASQKGDVALIKKLLDQNPKLINERGERGQSPLIVAIFARKIAAANLLIDRGTDVNQADDEGLLPIHFATIAKNTDLVKRLLDKGVDVNAGKNVINITPLHIAVIEGDTTIFEQLIASGARTEVRNRQGQTPFFIAASRGVISMAQLLISHRARTDAIDLRGDTPLIIAVLQGDKKMVDLLLKNGADINYKNKRGNSALKVALREELKEIAEKLISAGANRENVKAVELVGDYLGQPRPGEKPEVFCPEIVSTERQVLNSVFSPAGDEFYFTIREKSRKWRIVVMKRINNRWSKALTASFSGTYSDVDMSISPDGKKLYYCSNQPLDKKGKPRNNFDIWVVHRQGQGWSDPVNVGPPINSDDEEFFPVVTTSGALYFQSTRARCFGGRDIYSSISENGTYQPVENCGPAINSKSMESDAFISPDDRMMVFSSSRTGSAGQGDLYISFRDKKGQWQTAKRLGNGINTEAHENCPMLSPDGRYFFFTRLGDIYWLDARYLKSFDNLR